MPSTSPHPQESNWAQQDRSRVLARLNDEFRKTLVGGLLLLSRSLSRLDPASQLELIDAVREYRNFSPDTDPWGEHDYGQLTFRTFHIIWKIDYYDMAGQYHSPDPTNPAETKRVLTIFQEGEA